MAVVVRKPIEDHHALGRAQWHQVPTIILFGQPSTNETRVLRGGCLRRGHVSETPRSPEVIHRIVSFAVMTKEPHAINDERPEKSKASSAFRSRGHWVTFGDRSDVLVGGY